MGHCVHHISQLVIVLASQTLSASSSYSHTNIQKFLHVFPINMEVSHATPILMPRTSVVLVPLAETWPRIRPPLSTHHTLVVLNPGLLHNIVTSSSCCSLMLLHHSTSYTIIRLLHLSLKCRPQCAPTVFFLLQSD